MNKRKLPTSRKAFIMARRQLLQMSAADIRLLVSEALIEMHTKAVVEKNKYGRK